MSANNEQGAPGADQLPDHDQQSHRAEQRIDEKFVALKMKALAVAGGAEQLLGYMMVNAMERGDLLQRDYRKLREDTPSAESRVELAAAISETAYKIDKSVSQYAEMTQRITQAKRSRKVSQRVPKSPANPKRTRRAK